MHLAKLRTMIFYILLIFGLLMSHGCSANGYITASVQSVIGLDVSENPQTQVPHARFGFIRNQYYYIPTGKVVVEGGTSGPANETPELVSDIYVKSQFLQGIEIKEKFAVGSQAVGSGSARLMFNPEGKPVKTVKSGPDLSPLQREIRQKIQDPQKNKIAADWIIKKYPSIDPKLKDPDRFIDNPPGGADDLIKLLSELQ